MQEERNLRFKCLIAPIIGSVVAPEAMATFKQEISCLVLAPDANCVHVSILEPTEPTNTCGLQQSKGRKIVHVIYSSIWNTQRHF